MLLKKILMLQNIIQKKNKLKINYICSSPENLNLKKKFDIVLNLEVVEHVDDINFFIKKSSEFLKKNGLMFIATLNKTLKSYIFAIIGAEYILRWLPIGTHDWEKFVKPENLISICQKNSLKLKKIDGISKTDTILIINVPDIDSYACKILKFKWPFYLNVHLLI